MRMGELTQRSGLPRTTIHHYLREGLLPPPRKSARNAAEYGETHLERLRLIAALRSEELGPLPLDAVRGALAWIERGVEPGAAVGLQRAMGTPGGDGAGELAAGETARLAGVEARRIREWSSAGLLTPRRMRGATWYDSADVAMARLYAELFEATGLTAGDLVPLAELIREVSAYGRTLQEVARENAQGSEAERRAGVVERALEGMYRYLRARAGGPSPERRSGVAPSGPR